MINSKNAKFLFVVLITSVLSAGCVTTTLKSHAAQYEDTNIDSLLEDQSLSGSQQDMAVERIIELSEDALVARKPALALKYTKLASGLTLRSDEVQYLTAEAHLQMGQNADAEILFAQLTDKGIAKYCQGYGLSLLAQNKTEDAREWLLKATQQDADLWRSWNGLGIIADTYQDWDIAENAYKSATLIAGHKASINNNLGVSYLKQSRYEEAVIAFKNAQNLPGGERQSSLNYRQALALSGDMNQAVSGASDVELAMLYNSLGENAIRRGNTEAAVDYLKVAIAKSPSYFSQAEENLNLAKLSNP